MVEKSPEIQKIYFVIVHVELELELELFSQR